MFEYDAPSGLLEGKVILITGAGDGIGRALAKSCANLGATIILLGRTLGKLESVYDDIEQSGGKTPILVPFNLESSSAKDYEDLAALLVDEFGHLDGLVHNAGVLGLRSPIDHYKPEAWNKVMQINVTGPFLLTKALIPLLRESEDASIIFTSSSVGRKASAYWGAYAVSKFALEGLMQVVADELDDENYHIRANSVNPGATRTNMRAAAYPAENPDNHPRPEDILNVFHYLLGKDSEGVTGQAFNAQ